MVDPWKPTQAHCGTHTLFRGKFLVLCDEMLCEEGEYVYPLFPHLSSVLVFVEGKLNTPLFWHSMS